MSLASGTRLGPYEILAPLGAGGMGEVYRARDTRLDRSVAVKVLPSHLTNNPELRARFEREAKAVSSLNHPHICTLHDVGHHEGTDYLVMELVEGETLADRLRKGALPLDQTLRIGIEIADALDKAHRQGVIHRDLKPGNVMLTKSGSKLMDFGLAKLSLAAEGVGTNSALPTAAAPLTGQGAILGTVPYMAPEQLEGKEADARSDLWAFGCLLYEMATGRRAFEGKSQASLISAIMDKEPPPISQLQPLTPPSLERLVKVCLAKDPDDRFQMAHDVMQELKWIGEAPSGVAGPTVGARGPTSRREVLAWTLAATGLFAVAGLIAAQRGPRQFTKAPEAIVTHILPPADSVNSFRDGFAVSPDGRKVAFSSLSSKGERLLWVRSLDRAQPQSLAGTDGANLPFWSPDGMEIGFFAGGKLKRVRAEGGSPQTVPGYRAVRPLGGSWGRDGSILVGIDNGGISRVDAAGGQPVTVVSSKLGGVLPFVLPDGERFLYDAADELFVGPSDERQPSAAIAGLKGTSHAEFAAPDRLVFWDVASRALCTQRVDLERARVVGPRQVLSEELPRPAGWPAFSVSPSGALAYLVHLPGSRNEFMNRMQWVDRSGQVLAGVGAIGGYWNARLSRDGRRIAADGGEGTWIYDAEKGIPTRLSSESLNWAVWAPTDDRVAYIKWSRGVAQIEERPPGGGEARTLAQVQASDQPTDWSPDGRYLLMTRRSRLRDVVMLDLPERRIVPFLTTDYNEMNAMFSPDGRYVAYQSDETGAFEIYLRPFPGPGPARRISSAGGQHPRWRADGKELFFLTADWTIMATPIRTQPSLEVGTPASLFRMPMADIILGLVSPYDVAPDGKRFLVIVPQATAIPLTLTFVQNWTALLDR